MRILLFVLAVCCILAAAAHARSDEPAKFYRAINLNGPPLSIDGYPWDGKDAKDVECNGAAFENQAVPLKQAPSRNVAKMLRSSRWGGTIDVMLSSVPDGTYQVFLYVWEDNNPEKFKILLNDEVIVENYDSGGMGHWDKLGPWKVTTSGGKIKVSARGGAANFSGIEVWSGIGEIPSPPPPVSELVSEPTAEQLEFFERKIRPLLVDNCYECHSAGSKQLEGSLLLDSRAGLVKGGDTEPPIIAGDPDASLLISAVRYKNPALQMPPEKKLSAEQIADLEKWVRMGAPDPRKDDTTAAVKKHAIDWAKAREFWSFQPIQEPKVPAVKNEPWPRNDIDRFLLARLEAAGLSPTADADKQTFIRRVTYDLIGLPPTPEEVDEFLADNSAGAYERLVDRLLASPRYGERWGRHWLDVVRYADTAGDNSDFPIPQMVKYRDWVISAVNRDLPYDQFVREQLAGDLMPSADESRRRERVIATGYIANARRFGSRVDDYPQHLTIEDTIDNLGRAFLGLTINCARCHDHKFDPISNHDYYALYGIFHSTRYPWPGIELEQKQRDLVPLVSPAEVEAAMKARRERQQQLEAEVKRLTKERDEAKDEKRKELEKSLAAAKKGSDEYSRSAFPYEQAYAVADAGKIEDVRVQQKGDPAKAGPLVKRRFLTALGGAELPPSDKTSGRLQLAQWIVDPKNPLTPRVIANRIWQGHFGRGIVPTPNDFGKQGKPPTHPELLDYLAVKFMQSGWSMKSLHRLIVLSRTYQVASHSGAEAPPGPANDLYAFFPRRRLNAEAIRDTLLVLGGNLDLSPAPPHPFPPQTEWKFTQHNPFKAVYDSNRRSVYLMTQRIQRHPYLAIFDGADPSASTPQRLTSTTPLQALYLLNDPFVHDQAARFAARIAAEGSDDAARVSRAYRLALSRPPAEEELKSALEFLSSVRSELAQEGIPSGQVHPQDWQAFARSLFRLNEFVYID